MIKGGVKPTLLQHNTNTDIVYTLHTDKNQLSLHLSLQFQFYSSNRFLRSVRDNLLAVERFLCEALQKNQHWTFTTKHTPAIKQHTQNVHSHHQEFMIEREYRT